VDNFAVTYSKNNNQIHRTYKEFFDKPVSYHGAVTVGTTKGVSEFASSSKFLAICFNSLYLILLKTVDCF